MEECLLNLNGGRDISAIDVSIEQNQQMSVVVTKGSEMFFAENTPLTVFSAVQP